MILRDVLCESDLKTVQKLELEALVEFDRVCRKHGINYCLTGGTLLGAIRHGGFIPWDDDIDVAVMRSDYDKLARICKKELNSKFFFQNHNTDKNWYRLFSKIRINNTVFKELAHKYHHIHHGVYIDVFPLDAIPNNAWKAKIQSTSFHFWNVGLSAKYINLEYRMGKNRIFAKFARLLFSPFSIPFLYRKADNAAKKYNDTNSKLVINFSGAYGKREAFPKSYFVNTIDYKFDGYKLKIPKAYDYMLKQLYGDYMKLPPKQKRVSHHKIVDFYVG